MSDPSRSVAKNCCTMERKKLIKDIRKCDFCSTDWEEHHDCLSKAAKKSHHRSKACMVS